MANLEREDEVEREYNNAIRKAIREGDNDKANELVVGLAEYRRAYKPRNKNTEYFEK